MYNIVTFFIYFKVHPCMDNKKLEHTSQTSLIHKKIGNIRVFCFFFNRKRMLILSAIVLKGLRHDLRLKFLIFMYLNGLSA